MMAATLLSPPLTAREREQAKTAHEKAVEISGVIGHAAACTVNDTILNTPVELLTKRFLGYGFSTTLCKQCQTGAHSASVTHQPGNGIVREAGLWIGSEIAGDAVGTLPVIWMQKHMPGAVDAFSRALTYLIGPVFHFGAEKEAVAWGIQHGLEKDSPEVRDRTKDVYVQQMQHATRATLWTGFSTAACLGFLRLGGDKTPVHINLIAKLVGVSTSFLGLVGMRGLFPGAMAQADEFGATHITTPLTKLIAGTVGIDGKTVDRMAAEEQAFQRG
jgi:hypothetical protein